MGWDSSELDVGCLKQVGLEKLPRMKGFKRPDRSISGLFDYWQLVNAAGPTLFGESDFNPFAKRVLLFGLQSGWPFRSEKAFRFTSKLAPL